MRKVSIENEPCSECLGKLEKRYISQVVEKEGITVKLSGILAFVCTKCGDIYFQPGGADKIAEAVSSLFDLAIMERQHKNQITAQIFQA
ncbi:MAG TPA: YgiT-type zinc finger protein [Thermodesulfovibrionia bacterium]|nr:YgiT-type zinc finger protein [Thermodesulfovibrionia bacterium]